VDNLDPDCQVPIDVLVHFDGLLANGTFRLCVPGPCPGPGPLDLGATVTAQMNVFTKGGKSTPFQASASVTPSGAPKPPWVLSASGPWAGDWVLGSIGGGGPNLVATLFYTEVFSGLIRVPLNETFGFEVRLSTETLSNFVEGRATADFFNTGVIGISTSVPGVTLVELGTDTTPVPPVPSCLGVPATIYVSGGLVVGGPDHGRPYRGILKGTKGDDVILGTEGDDRIKGRGGNDIICGGDGDDKLFGRRDAHVILDGGPGNDVCKKGKTTLNCESPAKGKK
jgi:hypothetical protein